MADAKNIFTHTVNYRIGYRVEVKPCTLHLNSVVERVTRIRVIRFERRADRDNEVTQVRCFEIETIKRCSADLSILIQERFEVTSFVIDQFVTVQLFELLKDQRLFIGNAGGKTDGIGFFESIQRSSEGNFVPRVLLVNRPNHQPTEM